MFSSHKGEFGYLKKQPIRIGLFTLLMLLICAGIFITGYIIKGDSKNILTVAAVLGMLPVAKLIVSFIMYLKAEKCACSKEVKEKFEDLVKGTKVIYGFDFYMTDYKENFPLFICVSHENCLLCLLADKKYDSKLCKEYLEKYLKNNEINGINISIFDNTDKFISRCKSLDFGSYEISDKDLSSFALVKNLSL